MREWYRQLKIEYQIALWSLIVISGLILALIPCFFFSLMEIPQGIALGGIVSIIIYVFLGLFEKNEDPKKSLIIAAIMIAVRLLVIGGILFLTGWLYYNQGLKAFNIFAVTGGYLIPIVINIILVLVRKEK